MVESINEDRQQFTGAVSCSSVTSGSSGPNVRRSDASSATAADRPSSIAVNEPRLATSMPRPTSARNSRRLFPIMSVLLLSGSEWTLRRFIIAVVTARSVWQFPCRAPEFVRLVLFVLRRQTLGLGSARRDGPFSATYSRRGNKGWENATLRSLGRIGATSTGAQGDQGMRVVPIRSIGLGVDGSATATSRPRVVSAVAGGRPPLLRTDMALGCRPPTPRYRAFDGMIGVAGG